MRSINMYRSSQTAKGCWLYEHCAKHARPLKLPTVKICESEPRVAVQLKWQWKDAQPIDANPLDCKVNCNEQTAERSVQDLQATLPRRPDISVRHALCTPSRPKSRGWPTLYNLMSTVTHVLLVSVLSLIERVVGCVSHLILASLVSGFALTLHDASKCK